MTSHQIAEDPADTVHIGKDSYLFLSGGGQNVFSYFSGERDATPRSVGSFLDNLTDRAAACAARDRLFRQIIFPDKCVALNDHVQASGKLGSLYQRCYADAVAMNSAASAVFYPLETLTADVDNFTRTDTHYSARGNLTVTQAIMSGIFPELLGPFKAKTYPNLTEKADYSGDLGRKFAPARTEIGQRLSTPPCPIKMASNGLVGGNDGILLLLDSPEALTNKTLLIFGDSFFRQILPMLAVFYRRIVFCRTRYFQYEMVEAIAPDHIFCGIAERYLSHCYPDATRPHFLSYPLVFGKTISPDASFPSLWHEFVNQKDLLR